MRHKHRHRHKHNIIIKDYEHWLWQNKRRLKRKFFLFCLRKPQRKIYSLVIFLMLGLTKTRKHVIRDVGPIKRQGGGGGGGRSFSKGPSLMIGIRFFGMTMSEIFKMTGILNK